MYLSIVVLIRWTISSLGAIMNRELNSFVYTFVVDECTHLCWTYYKGLGKLTFGGHCYAQVVKSPSEHQGANIQC